MFVYIKIVPKLKNCEPKVRIWNVHVHISVGINLSQSKRGHTGQRRDQTADRVTCRGASRKFAVLKQLGKPLQTYSVFYEE